MAVTSTCYIDADEELSPEIATTWLVSANLLLLSMQLATQIATFIVSKM